MTPNTRPWDSEGCPRSEDLRLLAVIAEAGQLTLWQIEQRTGLRPEVLRVQVARLYHSGLVNRDGSFFIVSLDGRRALHLPVPEDRRLTGEEVY